MLSHNSIHNILSTYKLDTQGLTFEGYHIVDKYIHINYSYKCSNVNVLMGLIERFESRYSLTTKFRNLVFPLNDKFIELNLSESLRVDGLFNKIGNSIVTVKVKYITYTSDQFPEKSHLEVLPIELISTVVSYLHPNSFDNLRNSMEINYILTDTPTFWTNLFMIKYPICSKNIRRGIPSLFAHKYAETNLYSDIYYTMMDIAKIHVNKFINDEIFELLFSPLSDNIWMFLFDIVKEYRLIVALCLLNLQHLKLETLNSIILTKLSTEEKVLFTNYILNNHSSISHEYMNRLLDKLS